jgi:hypothetical protein
MAAPVVRLYPLSRTNGGACPGNRVRRIQHQLRIIDHRGARADEGVKLGPDSAHRHETLRRRHITAIDRIRTTWMPPLGKVGR